MKPLPTRAEYERDTYELAKRCMAEFRKDLDRGEIDTAEYRRFLRAPRKIVMDYERGRPLRIAYPAYLEREAPTSLATEGRVLPYMGRHRLGQETNAGR